MADRLSQARRAAHSPWADVAFAALVAISGCVIVLTRNAAHDLAASEIAAVLITSGAIAMRRRYPLAGSLVAGGLVFVLGAASGASVAIHSSFGSRLSDTVPVIDVVGFTALAYSIGAYEPRRIGIIGVVAVLLGINGGGLLWTAGGLVFPVMGSFGPWLAGCAVRSWRGTADQLAARAHQLEEEREAFAREAVRYERARIARELHDIIAHCVSVMVVQASAGQRLAIRDPARAAEALGNIAEAAHEAGEEMSRLIDLLSSEATPAGEGATRLVDELVSRAAWTGLPVTCRIDGSLDTLAPPVADAAYRVAQESLTNALKHAPGAAVVITVRDVGPCVELEVVNEASLSESSGLELAGGGHGVTGMRERVAGVGGELVAGPAPGGGWRVLATLPRGGALRGAAPTTAA